MAVASSIRKLGLTADVLHSLPSGPRRRPASRKKHGKHGNRDIDLADDPATISMTPEVRESTIEEDSIGVEASTRSRLDAENHAHIRQEENPMDMIRNDGTVDSEVAFRRSTDASDLGALTAKGKAFFGSSSNLNTLASVDAVKSGGNGNRDEERDAREEIRIPSTIFAREKEPLPGSMLAEKGFKDDEPYRQSARTSPNRLTSVPKSGGLNFSTEHADLVQHSVSSKHAVKKDSRPTLLKVTSEAEKKARAEVLQSDDDVKAIAIITRRANSRDISPSRQISSEAPTPSLLSDGFASLSTRKVKNLSESNRERRGSLRAHSGSYLHPTHDPNSGRRKRNHQPYGDDLNDLQREELKPVVITKLVIPEHRPVKSVDQVQISEQNVAPPANVGVSPRYRSRYRSNSRSRSRSRSRPKFRVFSSAAPDNVVENNAAVSESKQLVIVKTLGSDATSSTGREAISKLDKPSEMEEAHVYPCPIMAQSAAPIEEVDLLDQPIRRDSAATETDETHAYPCPFMQSPDLDVEVDLVGQPMPHGQFSQPLDLAAIEMLEAKQHAAEVQESFHIKARSAANVEGPYIRSNFSPYRTRSGRSPGSPLRQRTSSRRSTRTDASMSFRRRIGSDSSRLTTRTASSRMSHRSASSRASKRFAQSRVRGNSLRAISSEASEEEAFQAYMSEEAAGQEGYIRLLSNKIEPPSPENSSIFACMPSIKEFIEGPPDEEKVASQDDLERQVSSDPHSVNAMSIRSDTTSRDVRSVGSNPALSGDFNPRNPVSIFGFLFSCGDEQQSVDRGASSSFAAGTGELVHESKLLPNAGGVELKAYLSSEQIKQGHLMQDIGEVKPDAETLIRTMSGAVNIEDIQPDQFKSLVPIEELLAQIEVIRKEKDLDDDGDDSIVEANAEDSLGIATSPTSRSVATANPDDQKQDLKKSPFPSTLRTKSRRVQSFALNSVKSKLSCKQSRSFNGFRQFMSRRRSTLRSQSKEPDVAPGAMSFSFSEYPRSTESTASDGLADGLNQQANSMLSVGSNRINWVCHDMNDTVSSSIASTIRSKLSVSSYSSFRDYVASTSASSCSEDPIGVHKQVGSDSIPEIREETRSDDDATQGSASGSS